jgi:hypothetical protein
MAIYFYYYEPNSVWGVKTEIYRSRLSHHSYRKLVSPWLHQRSNLFQKIRKGHGTWQLVGAAGNQSPQTKVDSPLKQWFQRYQAASSQNTGRRFRNRSKPHHQYITIIILFFEHLHIDILGKPIGTKASSPHTTQWDGRFGLWNMFVCSRGS